MPYKVFEMDGEHCVYKLGSDGEKTGDSLGCHPSADEAQGQIAAIEANEERSTSKDEKAASLFMNFWQGLKRLLGDKPRALSMESLYENVYELAEDKYPGAWLMNVFADDNNSLFAILQSEGKLYRSALSVMDGNAVEMADWVEVKLDFPEVQTRTVIRQQPDGGYRWFSISATSVLNRVGEIDSRELFDSFVAHAEKTGEYPIRQFYHQGEVFRTGQADYLTRDGYCYITSGLFDDTPLARAEVEARAKKPDYWGESIGYKPTTEPYLLEVTDGIKIPVYRAGINKEISTLPEREAANLFTVTRQQEVNRMLEGKPWEAFLELWGGDEEKARKWLEENAGQRNRTIDEAGLITREAESEQPAETPEAQEVEVDMSALAEEITRSAPFVELADKLRRATEALTKAGEQITTLTGQVEDLQSRLAALEVDEDEKRRKWQEDLPRNGVTTKITYRPREVHRDEAEAVVETAAQRAEKLRPKNAYK